MHMTASGWLLEARKAALVKKKGKRKRKKKAFRDLTQLLQRFQGSRCYWLHFGSRNRKVRQSDAIDHQDAVSKKRTDHSSGTNLRPQASPAQGATTTDNGVSANCLSSLRNPSSREAALLKSLAKAGNVDVIWQMPNGEGVTGRDLALLLNGNWLNSEVVSTYFALLKVRCDRHLHENERESLRPQLRVHCFNSFFYTKYEACGYQGVRRWTKKMNLFSYDLVLFPINHNNIHWALIAVNFQTQRIEYYDSLLYESKSENYKRVISSIREYLKEEAVSNGILSFQNCNMQLSIMDVPQQVDGASCGVFVCAYADCVARGCSPPFAFTHKDVRKLQMGMASDILRGYLA